MRDMNLNGQEPASETQQGNTPNTHTPTTLDRRHVLQECARRLQFNQVLARFHLYSSHSNTSGFGRASICCTCPVKLLTKCWVSLHGAYSSAHVTLVIASFPTQLHHENLS